MSTLSPFTHSLAQSNANQDYYHQHKDAEKYQKNLMKQRLKQEKAQAKVAKAALARTTSKLKRGYFASSKLQSLLVAAQPHAIASNRA